MKKYLNQKEVLFVVPARSGSKGVKNKNLQICAGESLLRRAVNLALDIDIDSRVIVSTDSEDYIEHVSDLECSNHFLRPTYLSGSAVGDIEVLTQALHASEILFNASANIAIKEEKRCFRIYKCCPSRILGGKFYRK